MKYENVTLKEIAEALNLSTSTVSRALRDSYEISVETKKLVVAYAESVNYRPNPVALRLKGGKTRTLAVMVSEIANTYFSEAINGIESVAYNNGYHVLIAQSHESGEREKANVMNQVGHSADGMLISVSSGVKNTEYLSELSKKGFPIVFFDRILENFNTFKVAANNQKGAYEVTKHLISQGYKRIGHVTSAPALNITRERLKGYKNALEESGIPFDETLVKNCNNGGKVAAEIEESLDQLMHLKNKPDAILGAGDRITILCFDLLQQHYREEKIGYAGFSNSKIAHLFSPSLTVVRQPAFEIGQEAARLLIKMIESKRPIRDFETKVMDTELIVRDSSARKRC